MNAAKEKRGRERTNTKSRLSDFARQLLEEWHRLDLPVSDARILIAVSGGADSTALLLAVHELIDKARLTLKATIAHLDHGLRGVAGAADAVWVEELARKLGFDAIIGKISVRERAAKSKDNLEQAARRARYEFLAETSEKCGANAVLTAHTINDQAETVLLRLLRGSGADGLSGIESVRALVAGREDVRLARPLLRWARRIDVENYCLLRGVAFRVDDMNADEHFARVRVRKRLLPLLAEFNPRIVETLARTADLLREDAATLDAAAARLLSEAAEECSGVDCSAAMRALRVDVLRAADVAVRRRALRQWIAQEGQGGLRRVTLVHLACVENLLIGERGGRKALLPGGAFVERRQKWLRFYADGAGS
ncbi:MAG: tRNA lysidine(34) synthetase TilS [Pyrinomonadaceae bacterium]